MDSGATELAATNKVLAKRVKEANRSEIHRTTGISLSGVSRILNGRRTARADNLRLIADALGVEMGALHGYLKMVQKRNRASKSNGRAA